MPYPEFDAFKVDHLLAIVGSNPLPAAVAGDLLTSSKGKVTLVSTETALPVATKLTKWLSDRGRVCNAPLVVLEADMGETMKRVKDRLQDAAGRVGLNYTGGTKSMSVHVYRAVDQWAQGKQEPIFSYLDARQLSMVFDPLNGYSGRLTVPIPFNSGLHFDDLIKMHGWTKRSSQAEPVLPITAQALCALYAAGKGSEWSSWKASTLRPQCWEKMGRGSNVLSNLPPTLALPTSAQTAPFVEALRQELTSQTDSAMNGNDILFAKVQSCSGVSAKDLCEFFDGKWLEVVVLEALKGCQLGCGLQDMSMNLIIELGGQASTYFELDDVAVRGYQLFAFSCGTAFAERAKKELKLKLFEAYTRARQIGGDEARVALVCPYDRPTTLQAELSDDLGTEGKVRVFGLQHLGDLRRHIWDWITEESQAGGRP